MNKDIKIGEWFCTDDGMAIAERIHDFYYEEYNDLPEDKKIGDYYYSSVEYKVFCDYDGKPIKRNRFKHSGLRYCEPLDKKYKKVLEQSIKNHPKEYASFVKFLDVQKETQGLCFLSFELPEGSRSEAVRDIEKIQKMLPQKYTIEDILNIAENNHCIIDLKKKLYWSDMLFLPAYLDIILGYTYGDFKGKRVLFHSFHYKVCEKDSK